MKKHLLQLFIGVAALLAGTSSVSAQVAHSESFDNMAFLPAGWTSIAGNPLYWTRQTIGNFPSCLPHSGAAMARFNSRTAPANTQQIIITPVVDLAGVGTDTARFSFWIFRDDSVPFLTVGDSLTVLVNTIADTAGATRLGGIARSISIALPDTQAIKGWYQYTFDIPASFNTSTNYFMIMGTSQFGLRIFIDDVEWASYPPSCSGTPTPGTIAASQSVICGGSGIVGLTLNGSSTGVGITYQWQSGSSSSGPWTNFGPNALTVGSGIISTTTFYRVIVTCTTSGLSDSTSVDSVIVNANPAPVVSVTPTAVTYCLNTTPAMLVGSGAVTYSWSPATSLDTIIGDTVYASPNNAVTYIVTGVDSFGCSDTASVVVTPHNTPNVNSTGNPLSVCQGGTVTLNATSQLGGVTYVWNPGSDTGATITVTPTSNTQYIVQGISAFGCSGDQSLDTVDIAVSANPAPTVTLNLNTATYCFGTVPVLLVVSGTSNVSYTWNPGAGLDTTAGDTVQATPNNMVTYTVTGTDSFGCSNSATVVVTPHNTPNVNSSGNPLSICQGDSVTLNATSQLGGVTYIWNPGQDTGATITIAPSSTTDFIVQGISAFGCTGDQSLDTVSITVSQQVTAAFSTSINQRTVVFNNTSIGTSWIWDFGDGNGSTQQNPTYTYNADGTFTVTLIVLSAGCGNDTITHSVTVFLSGINEINPISEFTISPNPFTEKTIVKFRLNEQEAQINLLNPLGQVITTKLITPAKGNLFEEQMNMTGLPGGIYLLRIKTAYQLLTVKIIKQ